MNKLLALGAAALSLALGAPAGAQMANHDMMQPGGPDRTTVTRTVDHGDGTRTVARRTVERDNGMDRDQRRTVVRRTVVREERNGGWHRHHRHCATRWHHHQRGTRCWTA